MGQVEFRKSTYSVGNPEQCVEAYVATASTRVRDSKAPELAVLTFSPAAWTAFTASYQVGE
jgi:hypothetical protein